MTLSNEQIRIAKDEGVIVIDPFNEDQLQNVSYDVRLGNWIARYKYPGKPVDPTEEADIWDLHNMDNGTRPGYWIQPGERVLGHTVEIIGATCIGSRAITSHMQAKSTAARIGLSACLCLPESTELRLSTGRPISIRALSVGDWLMGANSSGQIRPAKVRAKRRAYKKGKTVRTRCGREITASLDHWQLVSTKDGVHLVQFRDIRQGDSLPTIGRQPADNESLTPNEAALVGYMVADGCFQPYRYSFAKTRRKPEQRAEIKRLMEEVFPDAPEPKETDIALAYNGKELVEKIRHQFSEVCQKARKKRLPTRLLLSSEQAAEAFLRTYILCDGHEKQGQVEVSSRSEGLIWDVSLVANRLDAFCRIAETYPDRSGEPLFRGVFYGQNADKVHGRAIENQRGDPLNIPELLGSLRAEHGLTRSQLLGYSTTDKKSISQHKVREIAEQNGVSSLAAYANDVYWSEVTNVSEGEISVPMVDISLDVDSEKESAFLLGNGLLTLNCAGWGDVGYINRWTMEISNHSPHPLLLQTGLLIAQIAFTETSPPRAFTIYGDRGSYQQGTKLADIKAMWTPSSMLPKTLKIG